MPGLSHIPDSSRPRDAWDTLVCGGVERLTFMLMRGDPFTEDALHNMLALDRRLQAFSTALKRRIEAQEELTE